MRPNFFSIRWLLILPLLTLAGNLRANQVLQDIQFQGDPSEPQAFISIIPHAKKNVLFQKVTLEQYSLNASFPNIVFRTTQDLNHLRSLPSPFMTDFVGKLPVSFTPRIEELKVNGLPGNNAKFSIFSAPENIERLNELLKTSQATRTVFPSYSISFSSGGIAGRIEAALVLEKSDTIYRIVRNNFWFPFELRVLELGIRETPGVFHLTFGPVRGLRTTILSRLLEVDFPYKVVKDFDERPEGKEELTISQRTFPGKMWFFEVEYKRSVYEKFIILILYATPFLIFLRKEVTFLTLILSSTPQLLINLYIFNKEFISGMDLFLLLGLVACFFIDRKMAKLKKEQKRSKKKNKTKTIPSPAPSGHPLPRGEGN